MNQNRRRSNLVNKQLQGTLARRLVGNCLLVWAAVFALPLVVMMAYGSLATRIPVGTMVGRMVDDLWFPIMMSLLVLPIAMWDSIRFSHKIAGPMLRLRNELERYNNGQSFRPIELRDSDFFHEVIDEVNQMFESEQVGRQRKPQTETNSQTEEEITVG